MIDPDRVLRPLREEAAAIDRLSTYRTPAELSESLVASWRAVERSLRLFVRSDESAPADVRMSALSPTDLPVDALLAALRRTDRISLPLAGRLHELEQAVRRVDGGSDARPADADAAADVIERLEAEVRRVSTVPDVAPADFVEEAPVAEHGRSSRVFFVLLIVVATGAAWLLFADRGPDLEPAIAAFAAGDLADAAAGFHAAVAHDSTNVTALLYLGRIHRRERRHEDAATVLRKAVAVDPEDPHVRRELGWLFMDLGSPRSAAEQFEQAREAEPDEPANWIGLIRALRAAGDPSAEQRLREAPPEVRAVLASGG
jgi:hypothetical protein